MGHTSVRRARSGAILLCAWVVTFLRCRGVTNGFFGCCMRKYGSCLFCRCSSADAGGRQELEEDIRSVKSHANSLLQFVLAGAEARRLRLKSAERSSASPVTCIEADVEYLGFDIDEQQTHKAASSEACRALCQQHEKCFFWTWVKSTGTCHLRGPQRPTGRRQGTTTADFYSGYKYCAESNDECTERQVDLRGHDISGSPLEHSPSAEACQSSCKAHRNCFFWTWDSNTKKCYLKNPYALRSWRRDASTTEKISGAKGCNPTQSGCYEEDVDYSGLRTALEMETTQSPTECQQLCEAEHKCHAWTWQRDRGECSLKTVQGRLKRKKDATTHGLYSGFKTCYSGGFCYEIDTRASGRRQCPISKTSEFSPSLCHTQCLSTRGCQSWMWMTSPTTCYTYGSTITATEDENSTTQDLVTIVGPRTCPNLGECVDLDTEYVGHDIRRIRGMTGSQADCWYACQSLQSCQSWTYYEDSRDCLLKDHRAPRKRRRLYSVSGPRDCGSVPVRCPPGTDSNVCVLNDSFYTPDTLQQVLSAQSALECYSRCQEISGCALFSFYYPRSACYLFHSGPDVTLSSTTHLPQAVSGPVPCDSSHNGRNGTLVRLPCPPETPPRPMPTPPSSPPVEPSPRNPIQPPHLSAPVDPSLPSPIPVAPPATPVDQPPSIPDCQTLLSRNSPNDHLQRPPVSEPIQRSFAVAGFTFSNRKPLCTAVNTRTPWACQELCSKIPDCHRWTVQKTSEGGSWECHLMMGTDTNLTANKSAVSGTKNVDVKSHSKGGCRGIASETRKKVSSFAACQLLCAEATSCEHWAFDVSTNTCTFYKVDEAQKPFYVRCVHGGTHAVALYTEDYADMLRYNRGTGSTVSVTTASECKAKASLEFPFWVFEKRQKTCTLFKAEAALTEELSPFDVAGYIFTDNETFVELDIQEGLAVDTTDAETYKKVTASTFRDCVVYCEIEQCYMASFHNGNSEKSYCLVGKRGARTTSDRSSTLYVSRQRTGKLAKQTNQYH